MVRRIIVKKICYEFEFKPEIVETLIKRHCLKINNESQGVIEEIKQRAKEMKQGRDLSRELGESVMFAMTYKMAQNAGYFKHGAILTCSLQPIQAGEE